MERSLLDTRHEAMHISEGVLSAPILAGGAALALAGTAIGLKRLDQHDVPKVAVLTATFFVATLVHVPLGPASIHLVLNGLVGLVLGWACFPAILVALLLQAVFFQYGGLTVLGVNTVIMALPALVCFLLLSPLIRRTGKSAAAAAFLAGSLAILGSGALAAGSLAMTGQAFVPAAKTILAAHVPVMILEGIITAVIIGFLKTVRPEMLTESRFPLTKEDDQP